ncbi:MAG: PilN domain-containing protein [Acidobacteriota bacterium]
MLRPNLAREPLLDTRPVVAVSLVLAFVALVLTAASVADFLGARGREREQSDRLEALRQEHQGLRAEVEAASRRLAAVGWKQLESEASSLGSVAAKRSLSWSRMLADLERVVPWNVRLTSINPGIDDKGVVTLSLTGVAADRDSWLQLIARCFADEGFSDPRPSSEEAPIASGSQGYQFVLSVKYTPGGGR